MSSIGSSGESLSALLAVIADPATHKARLDEQLQAEAKADPAMERLRETVAGVGDQPPKTIVDAIFQSVSAYAAGAPQSDDITVLVLHYRG